MTSFRLKNMTIDHILPLDDLYNVVGDNVYTRIQGTKNVKVDKNKEG